MVQLRAMKAAYKMAGEPKIDYVNAHGTSTPINDKNETAAVKELLGGKENCPPMSSIKGQLVTVLVLLVVLKL